MPTRAWLEIRLALIGTLRLARGDRGGLACFDRSADGFWRSFRAAVISYPLYLVLLSMRVTVAEWERSGAFLIITVETIAYVIAWTAFPLLIQPNGDIVAGGSAGSSSRTSFALARYLSTGQLDTTFGIGGLVTTSFGPSLAGISALALQTDGKILGVGTDGAGDLVVARYLGQ